MTGSGSDLQDLELISHCDCCRTIFGLQCVSFSINEIAISAPGQIS